MKKVALLILIAACIGAGGVRADPSPVAATTVDAKDKAALPKPQTRCEPPAGSRINPKPDDKGNCPAGSALVRIYSNDELKSTGQTDLGQALQQLDPAIGRSR
ncbi:MAG: hypothetical protein Q7J29_07095 [Stagnimonas sp.]|nr:hypothetical protein [Stagnimonas sp.]